MFLVPAHTNTDSKLMHLKKKQTKAWFLKDGDTDSEINK